MYKNFRIDGVNLSLRISHVTTCHTGLQPCSSHEYVTRNPSRFEVFLIIVTKFVPYDLSNIIYTTWGRDVKTASNVSFIKKGMKWR